MATKGLGWDSLEIPTPLTIRPGGVVAATSFALVIPLMWHQWWSCLVLGETKLIQGIQWRFLGIQRDMLLVEMMRVLKDFFVLCCVGIFFVW